MSFYANHSSRRETDDKVEAQRRHARRRAQERYGINLDNELLIAWVSAIQGQNPAVPVRPLGRESTRLTHFAITHGDIEVPVVYDKQRKQIVTVLPESGLLGPGKGLDHDE
ncbi:MAG TPA: hypothetical protein VFH61_08140 [Thermoleophilia bacterium]|nr:hypothetical protein [Thermoleophilia bacterium]